MSSNAIHVVRTTLKGSGSTSWYWDEAEAQRTFNALKESAGTKVELFRIFSEDIINYYLDDILNDQSEVNYELIDSHDSEDDVTWTELDYRPEGYFYIERLKNSTSEYWPFKVEPYEDRERQNPPAAWRLIDATDDKPMAIIRHRDNSFRITVNGYSQPHPYITLKAAVIGAVSEFNG